MASPGTRPLCLHRESHLMLSHWHDILRLLRWSWTRHSQTHSVCVWERMCVFKPVDSDWLWSVESWRSVRVSHEARDHRAETDKHPLTLPFFFRPPSLSLSHSLCSSACSSQSTYLPLYCCFSPLLRCFYWYTTLLFMAVKMSCRLKKKRTSHLILFSVGLWVMTIKVHLC